MQAKEASSDCLTEFLASLPAFDGLEGADLERIKGLLRRRHFKAGQPIAYQADPDPPLYLLEMGRAKVFKMSESGKEQVLWIAEPGDVFCLASVFRQMLPANIDAVEDSATYVISGDDMRSLIAAVPHLSVNLFRLAAEHVVAFSNVIEELSLSDVSLRLSHVLIKHGRAGAGGAYVCELSQREMAAMVGSAREVVCRTLKKLESRGLVKVGYRQVEVTERLLGLVRDSETPS